ncbi:hypothetical protein [Cohnella silvisoli]|uniref:DNA-binding protein n=1 Tax=Cohnella silvisoli TaxID=2873699 RepID=A0ABV1KYQ6_9BACL|nr:hypothetical protein [Cohnella silvisoli]MCD9024384.1 hypothetical protein [Cohnella silvisoli]
MSNVIKTKLPRNVAEALEGLRRDYCELSTLMGIAFRPDGTYVTDRANIVRSFARTNPDAFVSAIANGYEVEKTAEELADEARQAAHGRIRAAYKHRHSRGGSLGYSNYDARCAGIANGIKFTLNELGVSISGVNA